MVTPLIAWRRWYPSAAISLSETMPRSSGTPTPAASQAAIRPPLADYRRALHASTVLVFDAGADILADRPDAFASAAGDFLDRKARFAFAESVVLSR
jgi:hypothetical protein